MIDSRLIWYKHYYSWACELIAALDAPPQWIREIATIKYYEYAVDAINRFAYAEPFEQFDDEQCNDEYIACLYLRSESGATSWATFLYDAGANNDAKGGRHCCEYFYEMLTTLEDNEFSRALEEQQRDAIRSEFHSAIQTLRPVYLMFVDYFREYNAR